MKCKLNLDIDYSELNLSGMLTTHNNDELELLMQNYNSVVKVEIKETFYLKMLETIPGETPYPCDLPTFTLKLVNAKKKMEILVDVAVENYRMLE